MSTTCCKDKTNTDWDRFARIVAEYDAFDHLRSIHYCFHQYEYGRGWCTHAGVQDSRMELAAGWRADWRKPVVFDECKYEGNIASRWGNLSGDAMTRRFWIAAAQGTYCGHGETYLSPEDILWWSHGGVLHGTSPAKIAFLRKLLEETIAVGPGPIGFTAISDDPVGARRPNGSVIFYYFDEHQAGRRNVLACPKGRPTPPNTLTPSRWPALRFPANSLARPKSSCPARRGVRFGSGRKASPEFEFLPVAKRHPHPSV